MKLSSRPIVTPIIAGLPCESCNAPVALLRGVERQEARLQASWLS